jgi:hypothetical protein
MAVPAHDGKRQLMVPGGPVFALTSYASAGDSWRKPTLHVEMVGRQAGFFAQSPVLSTQSLFSLAPEH